MYANAYIVEGREEVVVIDGLLTRAASSALRERVDALGKPLRAVIVTHGHPDHYGGVAQLVIGREGVPVFAIEGVDAVIRRDDAMKGRLLRAFGVDWADPRTFPNVVLGGVCGIDDRPRERCQRLRFGDIALTPLDVGEAESHHDSVWILHTSDGDHAFVGDLVMDGVHAYTADAHTGSWLDALRRLEATLAPDVRLYPAHGAPGGLAMLGTQAAYLERFREAVCEVAAGQPALSDAGAREVQRRMVAFLGHDRVARWILEGAGPVANELSQAGASGPRCALHRPEPGHLSLRSSGSPVGRDRPARGSRP